MLKFEPLIDDYVNDYIYDKENLYEISNMFGSPLNILFPTIMHKNVKEFKDVFSKYSLKSKIYYAHKSNKSDTFVKQAQYEGICIDVASTNELKSALSNGFSFDRIEATGPKNDGFIILGVEQLITFNVDSIDELNTIVHYMRKIYPKNDKELNILIRLCGFKSENIKIISKDSKFGINILDIDNVINVILNNLDILNLIGFSFHLDTTSIKEKSVAIENILDIFKLSYEYGFNPYVINIGGGYKVNYISNKEQWNKSISNLKEVMLGKSSEKQVTWNDTTFGLKIENGVVKGKFNIYNYFDDITGGKYLDELLSTKLLNYQNRAIGDILSENMIELYIEPGRALLNQLGITVAKVTFVKQSMSGDYIIGLNMKRSDVTLEDQELFIDPIIISKEQQLEKSIGVYFSGNLCLESDLIYRHKVYIDKIPKKSDLVVFVNTAGYFMDFNSSDTIKQNIAQKIVAIKTENKFIHYTDKEYNPYILDEGF